MNRTGLQIVLPVPGGNQSSQGATTSAARAAVPRLQMPPGVMGSSGKSGSTAPRTETAASNNRNALLQLVAQEGVPLVPKTDVPSEPVAFLLTNKVGERVGLLIDEKGNLALKIPGHGLVPIGSVANLPAVLMVVKKLTT